VNNEWVRISRPRHDHIPMLEENFTSMPGPDTVSIQLALVSQIGRLVATVSTSIDR